MRDHCFRSIKYTELIGKKNAQYSNTGRANQPKAAKKEAQRASTGNGRRPHPRFLSKRLRFCPAAIRKASQLTRQSNRKQNTQEITSWVSFCPAIPLNSVLPGARMVLCVELSALTFTPEIVMVGCHRAIGVDRDMEINILYE